MSEPYALQEHAINRSYRRKEVEKLPWSAVQPIEYRIQLNAKNTL